MSHPWQAIEFAVLGLLCLFGIAIFLALAFIGLRHLETRRRRDEIQDRVAIRLIRYGEGGRSL